MHHGTPDCYTDLSLHRQVVVRAGLTIWRRGADHVACHIWRPVLTIYMYACHIWQRSAKIDTSKVDARSWVRSLDGGEPPSMVYLPVYHLYPTTYFIRKYYIYLQSVPTYKDIHFHGVSLQYP